ncbi:MAG: DUF3108 domain-containing protein [Candidatus Protistobacter heckmanni]|nr:DUF3108 domain-containing protein [Candidatus Protistobacter heckmanni]
MLLLTLAGHLALFWVLYASRRAEPPPVETLVETELIKPRPVQAAPPKSAPRPLPRSAPRPAPAAPLATPSPSQTADAAPAAAPSDPVGAADGVRTAAASGTPDAGPPAAPQPAEAKGEKFALPPSAQVVYDSFVNGMQNQSGHIVWDAGKETYRLSVEIPLPFVGTFAYRSQGGYDGYGLAPLRYEEARGKRAPTATNFNRDERKSVTFSRVSTVAPLAPGAQDRFSVVMQLAGLVGADPDRYQPGATLEFSIADNDSVETWKVQAAGEDPVETRGGLLPAKLRQTEPNGMVLERVFKERQTP